MWLQMALQLKTNKREQIISEKGNESKYSISFQLKMNIDFSSFLHL